MQRGKRFGGAAKNVKTFRDGTEIILFFNHIIGVGKMVGVI